MNILLTIPVFHSLSYLDLQRTIYKDSAVSKESNKRPTPTSDDVSYFSEGNDGGGKMIANKKGKTPQPIEKNEKKKKANKKKQGGHLSLISVGMEKFDKSPLLF